MGEILGLSGTPPHINTIFGLSGTPPPSYKTSTFYIGVPTQLELWGGGGRVPPNPGLYGGGSHSNLDLGLSGTPHSKCANVDPTDDSSLSVAMQSVLLVKFAAASNNLQTLKYHSFDQKLQNWQKINFYYSI